MAFDPNQQAPLQPAPNPQSLTEDQIRAMRGDLAATPAPAQAPAAAAPMTPAAPMAAKPAEPSLSIPAKPVFDADEPAFSPNTASQLPSSVDDLVAQHGSKKKLWLILGSVIGVLVLAAVGYFIVYPLVAGAPEPAPTTPPPPAAVTPAPPAAPQHVSAFVNDPAARVSQTVVAPLTKAAVTELLNTTAATAAAGTTEVVMTSDGAPVAFGAFLPTVAPSLAETPKTSELFANDFTAFIFKNAAGVWPGYVADLQPGFNPESLKTWFTNLEKASLAEFFMVSPGALQPFKAGMVNNKYENRYAAGKTAGASFGYLILPEQNKVVISTSFDGLKEALRLMGL